MSKTKNKTATSIRIWRRAFTGIYLVFTVTACVWTTVSLLAVHLGYYRPARADVHKIKASADDPRELRSCHHDVERLLTDLHHKAFELQAQALKFKTDPATDWRNWSAAWRHRWQAVDKRCRLTELGGKGVSPEIDRMQPIHAALAELQLGYSGVMDRFVERFAHRLRQMRRDLAATRTMIDRRRKDKSSRSKSR